MKPWNKNGRDPGKRGMKLGLGEMKHGVRADETLKLYKINSVIRADETEVRAEETLD